MILVVNMIPNAMSGETNQDSEPNIAVNPTNPQQIAGSAFTPNPFGGANAPIFVSSDGGNTWAAVNTVPSQNGSMTGDITLRFANFTNNLYTGILRRPGALRLNILRTGDFLGTATMTVLVDRSNVDQPYVQAAAGLGVGAGSDRIYVGDNDFSAPGGRTATVDFSLDAATPPPPAPPSGFVAARIETRTTSGQDGPPIRPAVHPDGTVYAGFYRWTAFDGTTATADVVVVRDDDGAGGATMFADLADASDNLAGRLVARNRRVPWANVSQPTFGQERFVGSNLSIAVDPRNSSNVYLAWADRVGTADYTLHVRHSTDRGVTWTTPACEGIQDEIDAIQDEIRFLQEELRFAPPGQKAFIAAQIKALQRQVTAKRGALETCADIRTITNATSPALAVNDAGVVGFLYQQLRGTGTAQRWVTRLERTVDDFATVDDRVLADVPANTPAVQFIPYTAGDYVHLMALDQDFYGIFSANNTPDAANFPNGVVYQRNADFVTNQLLGIDGVTPVAVSIDPFFFKVTSQMGPAVASWSAGRLDPFVVGTDGGLYHKAWDGNAWQPSIVDYEPLGGVLASPPAVAAWGPDRLDVFGLGLDRQMFHKAWDGNAWQPGVAAWEPLGGVFTSPPAVAAWGPDRLDIFGVGLDGALYHKAWDGAAWQPSQSGWERLGGVILGRPCVASWAANRLDIFAIGLDRALYHKAWDGNAWQPSTTGWERLGGVSDY